jgi:hypothetical protein
MISFRRSHRFLVCLFLILICGSGKTQEWNYARLVLVYGGQIPFNFNSVSDYADGIEVLEGTILGITMVDSAQAGHDLQGFELNIRSFNGATEIEGDANNLDLNTIRLQANNYIGFGSGLTTLGYQDLSVGWTNLCSYLDADAVFDNLSWDTHQISISYDCGIPVSAGGNGSLEGAPSDFYHVEIEIELIPTGPGF